MDLERTVSSGNSNYLGADRLTYSLSGGRPSLYSRKFCCCGGHNQRNAKSNLKNNGTRRRYYYRQGKQLKERLRKDLIDSLAS